MRAQLHAVGDPSPGNTHDRSLEPVAVSIDLAAFRWDVRSGEWWWSPELYRLYGYETGEVVPSLTLLLAHQHDADRERAEQAFDRLIRDLKPFVFEHRAVTRTTQPRVVILSVKPIVNSSGRPDYVVGTAFDVSEARRIHHAADEETVGGLQAQIRRLSYAAETRELISRATGVLIERHKITADEAFTLLRTASQVACRKLPDVASELLYSGRLPAVPSDQAHRPKPGRVNGGRASATRQAREA